MGSPRKGEIEFDIGAFQWICDLILPVALLHGVRELESGADGDIPRFTFSTKYAF